MPPVTLVDPATIDTSHVLVDLEGLRQGNPQRFEMEQLTAVVSIVPEQNLIIGYKDVEADEFWVRGHVPGLSALAGASSCARPPRNWRATIAIILKSCATAC